MEVIEAPWRAIHLISIWAIWKWQNNYSFQNSREDFQQHFHRIVTNFSVFSPQPNRPSNNPRMHINSQLKYLMGFFYSAKQKRLYASGVWISISKQLSYNILSNGGHGTNNKAEEMVLWGLVWFNNFLNILFLHVYGDSKIIIDRVLGKASINTASLQGWLKRI